MASSKSALFGTTIIAGVLALAAAAPSAAWAQATPPVTDGQNQDDGTRPGESEAAAASAGDPDDATDVEELVVTGSRIRRSEFTSSAPIQVITARQATLEGLVDTTELLQQSTVASGSFQSNNQLTGFVTSGGPGTNTISLRGLGDTRTLVLLNGRRVGPAGTRGTVGPVDLNTIPQSIVDRVEILKDGASSIYGSDAVAGVINIITKSNFDGGNVDLYASGSQDGGGEQIRFSGTYGKTFSRGYFNLSADYYERSELTRGDREDSACAADYLFVPDSDFTGPGGGRVDYFDASGGGFYKCFNLINNTVRIAGFGGDFQYPGQTTGYVPGTAGSTTPFFPEFIRANRAGFPGTIPYTNYETPLYDRTSYFSPVQRSTVYATGAFDLTSQVEIYGEALLNRRESQQNGVRQLFPTLARTNPNNIYGARAVAAIGAAANGTAFSIVAVPSDQEQTVDYGRGLAGLRGQFPAALPIVGGFDWDVFTAYSRSEGEYTNDFIYNDRIVATTGAGVACNPNPAGGNLSNFSCASVPGGIPYLSERFVAGNFTDAERAFIFGRESGNTEYTQFIVEGVVSGNLVELPAGPLGVAVGFHYREDEIDDTPGTAQITGNLYGQSGAGRTAGQDAVREVYGELEIPLIRGVPFVDELTAQLSGRYSDYDSYGSNETYKVGLNWQLTPQVRLRATQGTSYRAPALFELFLANQTGFLGQTTIDPCINYEQSLDPNLRANCASVGIPQDDPLTPVDESFLGNGSSALIVTGGGAGILTAETSESKSFGIVLTPSFVDLNIAIDYFEIEVEDEVAQFGAANILAQCYTSENFPNDPFCGLFTRNTDPTSADLFKIETVNNSYVNLANQINRGIDLTVRYEREFGFGDLAVDTQFTWQLEDVVTLLGGAEPDDINGQTTEPDFTGIVRTRFETGDWTFAHTANLIGKQSDTDLPVNQGDVFQFTRYLGSAGAPDGVVYFKQYNEFTATHDFSVTYDYDQWEFQAGIINIFDDRPPNSSNGQFRVGTESLNLYDIVGRQGFIRIARDF